MMSVSTAPMPDRTFRDRASEQVVALSARSEPVGVLMLMFLAWLALQALRLLGRSF
jgi:hypothetical protein